MLAGIYIPQRDEGASGVHSFDNLEADYFGRALRVLRKVNKDTDFLCFSEREMPPLCNGVPTVRISKRGRIFRSVASNAPSLEQVLTKNNVDVLLTTIDAPSVRTNLPKLVFALDMMIDDAPPVKGKLHPTVPRWVKRNCAEARLVLCPSQYMQKACSTQAEVGLEKTVLARAGVNQSFNQAHSSIIDGPYALFPMNRYSCQNIGTVTEAIRRNPSLFPPTLVIMGPLYKKEPANWGIPIIRVEQCPDNIVSGLMQNANFVLYPAQGDGGGMVTLQALRAGASLLTSKSGANFEVAGAVPFYFEAENPVSLLQIMRRMQGETPEEKKRRQQTGQTLVVDCTWERCAGKIVSAAKRSLL